MLHRKNSRMIQRWNAESISISLLCNNVDNPELRVVLLKASSVLARFLQQLDVMSFLEKKVGKSWAGGGRGSGFDILECDFLLNFLKWGVLSLFPSASKAAERQLGWSRGMWPVQARNRAPHSHGSPTLGI